MQLLVASDDVSLRSRLAAFLDCPVDFAQDPEEVQVKLLKNQIPQALIWDLRWQTLPSEGVLQTIQKICPQLLIVVLAWNMKHSSKPCFLQSGNLCIVQRPVSPAVLRTLVER